MIQSRFSFVLPCPQSFTFSHFSLSLPISCYSPQPHTLSFFPISQTLFPQKSPGNYAISWLWVGNIINLSPSDRKSVGQKSKLEFLQPMMQQSPQ